MCLSQQIAEKVGHALTSYERLVLLVGPTGSGKTAALTGLSAEREWPLVNLGITLSELLLTRTEDERVLRVREILEDMVSDPVVILDNTEILFTRDLKQNPLKLLQAISRTSIIIASWAGTISKETLTYAKPSHPEYREYGMDQVPPLIVVAGEDQ